jgi:hypothetical protein
VAGHAQQERLVRHWDLVARRGIDLTGAELCKASLQAVEELAEVDQLLDLPLVEDQRLHVSTV